MQKINKFFIIILMLFIAKFSFASGTLISSQTDLNTSGLFSGTGGSNSVYQHFGKVLDDKVLNSVSFYVQHTLDSTAHSFSAQVDCLASNTYASGVVACNSATTTTNMVSATYVTANDGLNEEITFDFSNRNMRIASTTNLRIRLNTSQSGSPNTHLAKFYGSASDTVSGFATCGDGTTPCLGVSDLYYKLYYTEFSSGIVGNFNPSNASTTASTSVAFSFDYQLSFSDSFNQAGVEYFNVLSPGNIFSSTSSTPILDGVSTFSKNITLAQGQYNWRPFLYSTSLNRKIYYNTSWINFSVVSNTLIADYLGVTDLNGDLSGLATTTCSITNVTGCFQNAIVFLFYPSQNAINSFVGLKDVFTTKIPFSYFYDIKTIVDNASFTATSSEIMINVKGTDFDLGEQPFLTTDVTDPFKNILDNLILVGAWISYLWYLVHRSLNFLNDSN